MEVLYYLHSATANRRHFDLAVHRMTTLYNIHEWQRNRRVNLTKIGTNNKVRVQQHKI